MSDAPNASTEIAKLTPEQQEANRARAAEAQQLARRMNYSGHGGIAVQNYEELVKLADTLARSGYFKDVKDAAQAVVKIQFGAELGIPPMAAMQNLYIVEGRVSMSAAMIAARINKSPDVRTSIRKLPGEKKGLEWDDEHCIVDWRRLIDGEWIDVGESSFTIREARMAGLVKDKSNWEKYPKAMCYNRAITQGARAFCPDLFFGAVYDSDSSEIEQQPERVIVEKQIPQSSSEKLTAHVEKAQAQATALPEVTTEQKKKAKDKKNAPVDAEVIPAGEGTASSSSVPSTSTPPAAPVEQQPAPAPASPTVSAEASTTSMPTASPSASTPADSAPSTPPSKSDTAAAAPDSPITIVSQTDVVAVESDLVPPTAASTPGPISAPPAATNTASSSPASDASPSAPTSSSGPASSPPVSPTSTPTDTGAPSAAESPTTNDDVQLIKMLKRIPRHNFGLMTEHLSSARSQLSPRGIELVRLLSKAEFQGQSRGDDQRFAGLSEEETNLAKEAAFMVEVNGGFTNPSKKDFDAMTAEQKNELASKNR